jgi:hypothetical protein
MHAIKALDLVECRFFANPCRTVPLMVMSWNRIPATNTNVNLRGNPFMTVRFQFAMPNDAEREFDMHDAEVVEIPLLLSTWQAAALETVAHERGYSAAELVRVLVRNYLTSIDRRPLGPDLGCSPVETNLR